MSEPRIDAEAFRAFRTAFVRLAARYAASDGLEVPVAVKVASGRRAGPT